MKILLIFGFGIFLVINFPLFRNSNIALADSCELPKECEIIKPYSLQTSNISKHIIKCELSNSEFAKDDSQCDNMSDLNPECDFDNKNMTEEKHVKFFISFFPDNSFSNYVLDKGFNFENLLCLAQKFHHKNHYLQSLIKFNFLQGFEVTNVEKKQINLELFNPKDLATYGGINMNYEGFVLEVNFYQSKMNFFFENKLIGSCDHSIFLRQEKSSNLTSALTDLYYGGYLKLIFDHCEYPHKLCPLLFNNSKLDEMEIDGMVDSFLKKNVLSFFHLKETSDQLITNLRSLTLINIENIEINNEILNEHVYHNLKELHIIGNDYWFHSDVFKAITSIKKIKLTNRKLNIFKNIGIEWMKHLNANVNESLDEIEQAKRLNDSTFDKKFSSKFIRIERSNGDLLNPNDVSNNFKGLYPDEDFCIYKNFPFNQLVIMNDLDFSIYVFPISLANSGIFDDPQLSIEKLVELINENRGFYKSTSCTFLWLIQFYPVYIRYEQLSRPFDTLNELNNILGDDLLLYMKNINFEKQKCNFSQRLNNCNSSNFHINRDSTFDNFAKKIDLSESHMIFIFLIPVVCSLGIYANILVIRTIPFIKKDKELKNRRHYDYMRINAVSNSFLFSIKIFGLINECTGEFWCSQIHRLVGVQYYKLIFSEFLGNSLRFFSNFTFLAFQLCRLSLIGQEHGRIVEKVSKKLSIKRFVSYFGLLSLVLSVVKYFRFHVNNKDIYSSFTLNVIDEYPVKLSSFDNSNGDKLDVRGEIKALIIINCIVDLLNYPIFAIICLALDIATSVELRKTLSKKIVTGNKKAEEEKEEAIFKSTLLIVLNALCNFLLKTPMAIVSIFEIIVSLYYNRNEVQTVFILYEYTNYFLYFLKDLKGEDFLETIANFLYFLSISFNFLFYYNFDRMFRFYFRKWYLKENASSAVSSPPGPQIKPT